MQGSWIAKSLNSSGSVDFRYQTLRIWCKVVDAKIMKIFGFNTLTQSGGICGFDPKCVLILVHF